MRTATTIGVKHGGGDVLIFGPSTPLTKQAAYFRTLLGLSSHDEYAKVTYQESDSHIRIKTFLTKEGLEKRNKLNASNAELQKKFIAKKIVAPASKLSVERLKAIEKGNANIQAEIDRLSKLEQTDQVKASIEAYKKKIVPLSDEDKKRLTDTKGDKAAALTKEADKPAKPASEAKPKQTEAGKTK